LGVFIYEYQENNSNHLRIGVIEELVLSLTVKELVLLGKLKK
jgi:hypothetical protein